MNDKLQTLYKSLGVLTSIVFNDAVPQYQKDAFAFVHNFGMEDVPAMRAALLELSAEQLADVVRPFYYNELDGVGRREIRLQLETAKYLFDRALRHFTPTEMVKAVAREFSDSSEDPWNLCIVLSGDGERLLDDYDVPVQDKPHQMLIDKAREYALTAAQQEAEDNPEGSGIYRVLQLYTLHEVDSYDQKNYVVSDEA